MRNNIVGFVSESEVKTPYGSSRDSHRSSHSSSRVGLEVTSIFDDYGSEMMFGNSLEEEISSCRSMDALIKNVGRGINSVEVFMHPLVLSEEEVRFNFQRREFVNDFTQVFLGIEGH